MVLINIDYRDIIYISLHHCMALDTITFLHLRDISYVSCGHPLIELINLNSG
jgi:hypothetical protein